MERSFLKVPVESLSQVFRKTQKTVTKELGAVVQESSTMADQPRERLVAQLLELESRLDALRAEVLSTDADERRFLGYLEKRLDHLTQEPGAVVAEPSPLLSSPPKAKRPKHDAAVGHRQERKLQRVVAESLLTQGFFGSATALSQEADLDGLLDIEVYQRVHQVAAEIRRGDCEAALAWCKDHASRLRRVGSSMEFAVRKRQFLELVRLGRKQDALSHACEYLSPAMAQHPEEVQQAMATLALQGPISELVAAAAAAEEAQAPSPVDAPPPTTSPSLTSASSLSSSLARRPSSSAPTTAQAQAMLGEYALLFSEECWDNLASFFLKEARRVYGLPEPTTLEVCLQSGLSVLKTPVCGDPDSSVVDCPVCCEAGRKLAAGLPFSHHAQSRLVCRMSGDRMDDQNRPLVMPNGSVYSHNALTDQAAASGGIVTCQRTGEQFHFDDLQSVYII